MECCEIDNRKRRHMGKLEGKVAVVTGAGSGMGRASALLFAEEGAKVVCADVSGREEDAAEEIGKAAIAVHADVSQARDVKAMFAAAAETFGRLDVVFNNAGFNAAHHPLDETDDDLFDHLVAVNLRGVFLATKHAAEVPLKVMQTAAKCYELLSEMAERGNPASISDVGVGALAIRACIEGAAMNVRINLSQLKDEKFTSESLEKLRTIRVNSETQFKKISEVVESKLR